MQCPHCKHQLLLYPNIQCLNCGREYPRQVLEEYEHLGYLMQWLDQHKAQIGEMRTLSKQTSTPVTLSSNKNWASSLWLHGERWRPMTRAARYLPQVLLPLSLVAILFVGGAHPQVGKMAAFLCAAIAYGLLAWKFPTLRQIIPALVSLGIFVERRREILLARAQDFRDMLETWN